MLRTARPRRQDLVGDPTPGPEAATGVILGARLLLLGAVILLVGMPYFDLTCELRHRVFHHGFFSHYTSMRIDHLAVVVGIWATGTMEWFGSSGNPPLGSRAMLRRAVCFFALGIALGTAGTVEGVGYALQNVALDVGRADLLEALHRHPVLNPSIELRRQALLGRYHLYWGLLQAAATLGIPVLKEVRPEASLTRGTLWGSVSLGWSGLALSIAGALQDGAFFGNRPGSVLALLLLTLGGLLLLGALLSVARRALPPRSSTPRLPCTP